MNSCALSISGFEMMSSAVAGAAVAPPVGGVMDPVAPAVPPVAAPEPAWLQRGRVPGLDGLRAVSISLVFAEHVALAAGLHGTGIVRKAVGNIGVLGVDVIHDLLERGVLRRENGRYELANGADDVAVPTLVQEALQARLDRLGAGAREVISIASVVGRSFYLYYVKASAGDGPGRRSLVRRWVVLTLLPDPPAAGVA